MRIALYARVSTQRQNQMQTIEQQLERLQEHVQQHGWECQEAWVFRDDGHSGASLKRPGLDRLRDQASQAQFDRVLITAPDRLARKYVHQMLLIEELEKHGCLVEFVERPMSQDPHDQLLLQIRGAVAEYERNLIADRMRRGRLQKYRAGMLLPWSSAPMGIVPIQLVLAIQQEYAWSRLKQQQWQRCLPSTSRMARRCVDWRNACGNWGHSLSRWWIISVFSPNRLTIPLDPAYSS
jgi:DNA invertase Pin-like site-specific DNA recombinase